MTDKLQELLSQIEDPELRRLLTPPSSKSKKPPETLGALYVEPALEQICRRVVRLQKTAGRGAK